MPLKKLGDKSLIDWTIDSALASSTISHLLLSTPDIDVISHVQNKYNKKLICHQRSPDWQELIIN